MQDVFSNRKLIKIFQKSHSTAVRSIFLLNPDFAIKIYCEKKMLQRQA